MTHQPQVIRTFTPDEQARWDAWLQAEVAKMIKTPGNPACEVLTEIIGLCIKEFQTRLEAEIPALVRDEVDALRNEINTQRETDREESKSWITKLLKR